MKDWAKGIVGTLIVAAIMGLFSLWRDVIELRVEVKQLQRAQEFYHGRTPAEAK